jgi:cob(I)alamin adenosyltransferase
MMPPAKRSPFRGFIQVYTGNGKGKTTAALGLALRAAGSGLRTYIGQFMKGQRCGELASVKKLAPFVTIEQYGRRAFLHVTKTPDPEDVRRARHGLDKCRAAILSGTYDIVVLDEVNVAVFFGLLSEQDVLSLLDEKPPSVELVLTGRSAPSSFIRRADLVTEMKERKHYYRKNVSARRGIER